MNKVILIGRLAADPEIRTTQSGTAVAQYRLAVDRRRKQNGQQQADFFNCIAWDKGAEFVSKHLTKGTKIGIEGHLQSRSYDAQDGSKRYVTEVVVESHEFCGSKPSDSTPAQAASNGGFTEVEDDELPF